MSVSILTSEAETSHAVPTTAKLLTLSAVSADSGNVKTHFSVESMKMMQQNT